MALFALPIPVANDPKKGEPVEMRIVVYMTQRELAEEIFRKTIAVIQAIKTRCELSCVTDPAQMRKQLQENFFSCDVLILNAMDTEGIAAANLLREHNFFCTVLFVSEDTAKLPNILRYRPSALVVDSGETQLKNALVLAFHEQSKIHPFFTVKNKEELLKVHYSQIKWFESRQRTVILHAQNRDIVFYAKLSDVYEQIPKTMFLRCHQSYIINTEQVRSLDKIQHCVNLTDGTMLEISKSYYPEVIRFFEWRK